MLGKGGQYHLSSAFLDPTLHPKFLSDQLDGTNATPNATP